MFLEQDTMNVKKEGQPSDHMKQMTPQVYVPDDPEFHATIAELSHEASQAKIFADHVERLRR